MKISNSTTNLVNQAYQNNSAQQNAASSNAKAETNKETAPSTNVDLSDKTKDIQKISQALENEPAARLEKINTIKNEINANQYTVDADKVADKMVGSLLDEII